MDLLDPDPDSEYGSGSTDLIESGSTYGSETLPVTEVGVLITAVGVPVTAAGVPASSFNVSEEAATAAAVVGSVVGVTGKLQNYMIVITKIHDSDPDQHLILPLWIEVLFYSLSHPVKPWKGCK